MDKLLTSSSSNVTKLCVSYNTFFYTNRCCVYVVGVLVNICAKKLETHLPTIFTSLSKVLGSSPPPLRYAIIETLGRLACSATDKNKSLHQDVLKVIKSTFQVKFFSEYGCLQVIGCF